MIILYIYIYIYTIIIYKYIYIYIINIDDSVLYSYTSNDAMEVTFNSEAPDPARSVVAKGTHPLAHRWEPWSKDPKHRCEPVPWLVSWGPKGGFMI